MSNESAVDDAGSSSITEIPLEDATRIGPVRDLGVGGALDDPVMSVPSGGDHGSISSASTAAKTRFSFYNAEEVQLQEQSRTTPQPGVPKRFNFYNPDQVNRDHRSDSRDADHRATSDNKRIPAVGGTSGRPTDKNTVRPSKRSTARERAKPKVLGISMDASSESNKTSASKSEDKMDSDDILRSLQDTEQMRLNLMQSCQKDIKEMSGLKDFSRTEVASRKQHTKQPETIAEERSRTKEDSNPYESAIREAIDLLRKHRPESTPKSAGGDMKGVVAVEGLDVTSPVLPCPRTPPEADAVLQSRQLEFEEKQEVEPTTNEFKADVIEARRKERQERMARYASRIAELKNEENDNEGETNGPMTSQTGSPTNPHEVFHSAQEATIPSVSRQPAMHTILDGDVSVETTSTLSATLSASYKSGDEVQRSVEKVLLAILERASSNGRGSSSYSEQSQPHSSRSDHSWQKEEEKKSSVDESESSPQHHSVGPGGNEDPLTRAVGELLSTGTITSADAQEYSDKTSGNSPTSGMASSFVCDITEQSSTTSYNGAKRSVVEELLAEAESVIGEMNMSKSGTNSRSKRDKKKKSKKKSQEDRDAHQLSLEGVDLSGDDVARVDRELDELVLRTLGKTQTPESTDADNYVDTCDDEDDADDEDDEDEVDSSYDVEDDISNDALDGVLGPLSKKAGGITGVVLDSPSGRGGGEEQSIFDSLSTAMSSLVASAMSNEERASSSRIVLKDKYSTDYDNEESDDDEFDDDDSESDDDESDSEEEDEEEEEEAAEANDDSDVEANELMRSLCAHLLPLGVNQSGRFLDQVPQWDESNTNEAGYRIIRLTNQQLHRVEQAFENMVNGLKQNSQQSLSKGYDRTFERDLAVAEKLLDREENRTKDTMKITTSNKMVMGLGSDKSGTKKNEENEMSNQCSPQNDCHPDFPGIHAAGKGEMGDLEYFHLPIIFKSKVTGFEPTKDMYLEQGNIVAGQYLVESELGSAAFSTAYRCVDLNSEGGDGEDGHEEVCLKVIKNTKDFFDQSLDEIKILELLRQTGKCHETNIIEMRTFFYHREHLVIVTELLRQNLFEFGKFILEHDEEAYFTLPRLAYITRQNFIALEFVHKLGLVHSDVKPENILLGSYSRAQVKLIDFGSSCYLTDRQSSYIQSRSYRAPEVILGLPYDGRIDVWSMGCVVAEMFTGEVTFQNDSIVSMLSRIEAICGPFPRHMIAQGRQSVRYFTKCGLLYERVADAESEDKTSLESDFDLEHDNRVSKAVFDIFQPKKTTLSSRLGVSFDLHARYSSGATLSAQRKEEGMFVDFVRQLLTIDPDGRLTAAEALRHPWMIYASKLQEEDIKYPSQ